jgi:hypothetical protein
MEEAIMDVPPEIEAAAEPVVAADAYRQFWDSVEGDATSEVSGDEEAADAYRRFWEVSDA